ncbi:MAG TPA: sn-glycerol-3-phosphate ABC transporter ATP-binding protein UgpC, partial [Rubrobacter sp.]|nr:sn-glycerol-3-phosphate ABC transporter ATP-binding protein UgpC [Rubrobacter sp.]
MAEVTLEEVTKVFGEDVVAVDKMNLDIPDGEFVVFVGPSGCGKSTALRMIAGLEDITGGQVFIGDQVVNDLPPRQRDIAMVFQNYALYPHMNVRENMGFALKLRKLDKSEISRRVDEAARILSIERFLDRKPKALSGGQRQRVALGRAIVREPKAFLMDEPLSNLDAKLRVQMRTEIAKLHNRIGTTTIYVTHDQTEAMTMADRIVVLKDGEVQQVDSPQQMYDHPNNVFVAGFIGSPAMNFLRARLEKENGGYAVTFGDTRMPLSHEVVGEVKERRGQDLGEHV